MTSSEPAREVTTIDLVSLAVLLKRNLRFLMAVFFVSTLGLIGWTLLSPVTFEATGSLELAGAGTGNLPQLGMTEVPDTELNVPSEIAILSSRNVVGKAIVRSGLNVQVSVKPGRTRYLDWLLAKRHPSIIDAGYSILRAVDASVDASHGARTLVLEFLDTSSFSLSTLDGKRLGAGVLGETMSLDTLQLTLMPNDTPASPGQRLFLHVVPQEALIDGVLDNLIVSSIKRANGVHSNVVTARFVHESPRMAADFLTTLLNCYLEERQAWKSEAAVAAEAFINGQLGVWASAIRNAHAELINLRTNNRALLMSGMQESLASQLHGLEADYSAQALQARTLASVRTTLGSGKSTDAELLGEGWQDPTLEELNRSLVASNAKLDELATRLATDSPDITFQRDQVNSQLNTITRYLDSLLARTRERQTSLFAVMQQLGDKITALPSADVELDRLTREVAIYDNLHKFLREQQEKAVVQRASTLDSSRVLDLPRAPSVEQRPNMRLRLEGLPLGLVLGVGLVLVSYFATGRYQATDILTQLRAHRVVGKVCHHALLQNQPVTDPRVAHDVLHGDQRVADSIRDLRVQLRAMCDRRDRASVLLFTSPGARDGKTTVALLLAWALADGASTVLYLDANLRAPNRFSKAQGRPFVDAVTGATDWSTATTTIQASSGSTLLLIQPTEPMAPELMAEKYLTTMIRSFTQRVDYVVIDGPASSPHGDVDALAPLADVVISVLRVDHTSRAQGRTHFSHVVSIAKSHALVVNGVA